MQRPLALGFDIVVHSVTKYLNGHSDMIGGVAVVGSRQDLAEQLRLLAKCRRRNQRARSIASSPCADSRRSRLRMERHCANAAAIADWLSRRLDVR